MTKSLLVWALRVTLAVFAFLVLPNLANAQRILSDKLPKGMYKVGFYSTIQFDPSQNYPFHIDSASTSKKAPKPFLINVWYPTTQTNNGKPMAHKGYLSFRSTSPEIKKWLDKFKKYSEDAITYEIFRKSEAELSDKENKLLDSLLNATTTSIKDAKPVKAKFPLIVYAQGAGGSIEDNFAFCELLASHGYVVIGSSFQPNDATYFGPDGPPTSVRDVAFILSFASTLPNVDYRKAGMVGHSLGGQKMLHYLAQGAAPFDAAICLETTQEYHTTKNKLWEDYVTDMQRGLKRIEGDILFAADASAIHELADQMVNANRYFLSPPELDHNDYIFQGIQRKYIQSQIKETVEATSLYVNANDKYIKLCNYMLQFFDAKLKNDSISWNGTVNKLASDSTSGFLMETMLKGETRKPYVYRSSKVPTARQLKYMIYDGQIDSAILLLKKYWHTGSKQAIYNSTFAYPIIDYLLTNDSVKAQELYKAYVSLMGDEEINHKFIAWAKFMRMNSLVDDADASLNALYFLNPNDRERIKLLIEKSSSSSSSMR